MKPLLFTLAGLLLLGLLALPLGAQAQMASQSKGSAVQSYVADLKVSEEQIQKEEEDATATQDKLDSWMLTPDDRNSLEDIVRMDGEAINAYQYSAHSDMSRLANHWKGLTSDQKASVQEAAFLLQEWGLN